MTLQVLPNLETDLQGENNFYGQVNACLLELAGAVCAAPTHYITSDPNSIMEFVMHLLIAVFYL